MHPPYVCGSISTRKRRCSQTVYLHSNFFRQSIRPKTAQTMENHKVERYSQSLDNIAKEGGTDQNLQSSERSIHEKNESLPPPQSENVPLTKWNCPRINIWRTLTAFLAFFIIGAHDGAYGVNQIPHHSPIDFADADRP